MINKCTIISVKFRTPSSPNATVLPSDVTQGNLYTYKKVDWIFFTIWLLFSNYIEFKNKIPIKIYEIKAERWNIDHVYTYRRASIVCPRGEFRSSVQDRKSKSKLRISTTRERVKWFSKNAEGVKQTSRCLSINQFKHSTDEKGGGFAV